jgi:hypothetical protein
MSGVPRLEVAGATIDLLLVRHEHSVGVTVLGARAISGSW